MFGKAEDALTHNWTLLVLGLLFVLGGLLEGFGILPLSGDDQVQRVFALAVLAEGTLVIRRIYRWVAEIRSHVTPQFEAADESRINALIDELVQEASAQNVTFAVSGLRYSLGAMEKLLRGGVKVQVVCPDPEKRHLFLSPTHQREVKSRLERIAKMGADIKLSPNAATMRSITIRGSSNKLILGWYKNEQNNTRQLATYHIVVRDTRSDIGRTLFDFAEDFVKETLNECTVYAAP